jgi:hypothetical protein
MGPADARMGGMGNVRTLLAALAVLLALLAAGLRRRDPEPVGEMADKRLTVWILENQPDRVRATRANVDRFSKASGFTVDLVAIADGQLTRQVESPPRAAGCPTSSSSRWPTRTPSRGRGSSARTPPRRSSTGSGRRPSPPGR